MIEKKLRTYVCLILDKSGSMFGVVDETVDGFNEQVQQIKENAQEQEIYVSLVTFNGNVFEHLWNEPADKLEETDSDDYRPSGSTAMRDAVGYAVQKLHETTDVDDENNAYVVTVISDGYENSSHHFGVDALKELIDPCLKKDNWTFSYIGCDASYLREVSAQTGISVSNMAAYDTSKAGTARAYKAAAGKMGNFLRARATTGICGQSVGLYTNSVNEVADFANEDSADLADVDMSNMSENKISNNKSLNKSRILGSGTAVNWKD